MENVDQPANKNHCQPSWVTVCPISPQISTLVIKRLVECAFVSPSVVAVATAAAVPEPVATATASTETPSPAASESSSVTTVTTAKASVTSVTELLLLQLWQLCGHSELPTATVLPCFLMEEQVGRQRISVCWNVYFHIFSHLQEVNYICWTDVGVIVVPTWISLTLSAGTSKQTPC